MAVDLDQVYLVLPVIGSAAALVGLWYLLAKLRHRRQLGVSMAAARPRSPLPPPETVRDSEGQIPPRGGRRRSNGGRSGGRSSQGIVTKQCQKTGEEFTFFWGPSTVLSQWYACEFTVDGVTYNCAEQYMMHQKAVLFGDERMAAEILKATKPKDHKALGRQVENFDLEIWNKKCKDIVKRGNEAKFSQNIDLKDQLLATGNTTLVEASPFDRIWGIGLGSNNTKATDRTMWRGSNWLGEILTQVRDELREQDTPTTT